MENKKSEEKSLLTEEVLKPIKDYFNGNEFPASVWWRKYRLGEEKTPRDMFIRMGKEFGNTEFEWIKNLQRKKKFINVNELSEYGRERYENLAYSAPETFQHHYFKLFDGFKKEVLGGSGMQGIGADNYSSLSNCFVMGRPVDSYAGIVLKELEILQTCKRRGGNGIDVSSIRPEFTPVNNQSLISNGPLLFVERYNHGIMEVSQNGRRGALMVSMHIKHPDSEKFIISKQDLSRFTGCNISVQIDNEFMKSVVTKTPYLQMFPIDFDKTKIKDYTPENDIIESLKKDICFDLLITKEFEMQDGTKQKVFIRKINAVNLWNTIIHCAWATGEPGIIFVDNHYDYSPDSVYSQYRQVTTNPCFHPNTKILTQSGYHKIGDLMGQPNVFWNGKNWSQATVQITGTNEMMYKVTLSDGTKLSVTGYHVWPTLKGNKTTLELFQMDEQLTLLDFDLPIVNYGPFDLQSEYYNEIGNYFFDKSFEEGVLPDEYNLLEDTHIDNRIMFINSVLNCKALDSFIDGQLYLELTVDTDKIENLRQFKLLLSTVGIYSRIEDNLDTYNLLISEYYIKELYKLGVRYNHEFGDAFHGENIIKSSPVKPKKNIRIVNIEEEGITEKVFCLTEKDRNMVCVEGVVTGNCGEIFMQPYDSCRLLALNLSSYVTNPYTDHARFEMEQFYKDCYEQLWTGNMLVELEIKYVQKIIDKIERGNEPSEYKDSEINLWKKIQETAKKGRRCGCGFLALGDLIAMMNFKYGSEKSLEFVDYLMGIKFEAELDATIDLAIIDKPFDGFDFDKEFETVEELEVGFIGSNDFYRFLAENYRGHVRKMKKYGRANISWNTVAPTGSLGILTQTTSGIEPCFLPMYKRRKKCITSDERVDFIDIDGQKFTEFYVLHEGFKNWLKANIGNEKLEHPILSEDIENIDNVPKEIMDYWVAQSPYGGSCANDIKPIDRIKMQSTVQKYVTHSISSTVNLPKECSEAEVEFIYMNAWKNNLKGITVYRDGSRQGVMVSADSKEKNTNSSETEFESNRAPKRPKRLKAHYYTIEYRKKTYSVIIGLYLNKPYEIFICSGVDDLPLILDGDYIEGELVKESKNWYYFVNEYALVKDIQDCQADEKLISLMVSGLLRHRTPLQFVIKMIQKSEPFVGTVTYKLCKILGKYVENGTEDGSICPDCGEHLRFEGGCVICPKCGFSKC